MAQQTQKPKAETPAEAPKVVGPVKGEENPEVNNLLSIAQNLRDEKAELFASIAANREILRNYAKMGFVSDEQVTAIGEFYPPHRKAEETPAETATPAAA